MISQAVIEEELKYYLNLKSVFVRRATNGKKYKIYTRWQHGAKRLYVYNSETGKETYIRQTDIDKLNTILSVKLYVKYLEQIDLNIDLLTSMKSSFVCMAGREEIRVKEEFEEEIKDELAGTFAENDSRLSIPSPIDHSIQGPLRYNPYFPENLIHKTPMGILMRSREEVLIGAYLESLGIEYEYDVEVWANGNRYYVDFLIRRLSDGAYVIWEHFGIKDSLEYDHKTFQKHMDFSAAGYRLGDNYICSYETADGGLDMVTISRLVSAFIMCA